MFRRPNPRLTRRLALLTTTFAGLYVYDEKANAQVLQRNTRTLYNGLVLAADYKLNFTAKNAAGIDDLHERVARRLLHVCKANGGLYIKLGQTIGAQSAVLPAAYQRHFRTLYDAAPAVGYDEVVKIFLQEFGVHPSDVFAEFSHEPVASASIAQVHRATLRNGTVVAVKVQKPEIRAQMGWDLMAYRALLTLYERLFDLPLKWSADYTERHLRMEADFENEGRNSELAWRGVQEEPTLKGRVYIPKVFWEYTGKRVLVCEWIDGVRLTDVDGLENIGVKPEEAMRTAVDMFASQIFQSGFVHGDPHPGNVLIRRHPEKHTGHQLVLIDHGLYIKESSEFRRQYGRLWKALFMMDRETVEEICKEWGINDSNMFASLTLQKPYNPSNTPLHLTKAPTMRDTYAMQMSAKERLRSFLTSEHLLPRELIFVGRNMSLVRACNKTLGSPVNRINIMARWAVRAEGWDDWANRGAVVERRRFGHTVAGVTAFLRSRWNRAVFEFTLMMMSVGFYVTRAKEKFGRAVWGGKSGGGFEEVLDARMKEQLKKQFGVVLDENAFDG